MTMTNDPSRTVGRRALVTTNGTSLEGLISAAGLGGVIIHVDGTSRHLAPGEITAIEPFPLRSGVRSAR